MDVSSVVLRQRAPERTSTAIIARLALRPNRTSTGPANRLTLFAEVLNVLTRENVRFNPPRVATNTRQSPASSTRSSRYCLPASFSNSDDRATQTSSAQAVERFTGALSLPAGRFRLVTVSRIPAKPAPMREDCTLQAVAAALLSIRCPQSFAVHVGRPPIAMLRTGPGARFDQLDRDPAAGAFSSGPVDLCPPCWGRCCHLQGLARASASCRCLHRSTARAREPASRIARRIACGGGCTSR